MKKFLIIFMFIIFLICKVSATEKSVDTLTKIENSILGTDYSTQKVEKRLDRLEEYVYGRKKQGKTNDRLQKLAKDLNADTIGKEVEPRIDMGEEVAENTPDSSVDYPIIKDVERSLNINSKPAQSLHSRLVAIEKQLFQKVFDTDDFYTRVERIKGKVYKTNDSAIAENYDYDDEIIIPEFSSDEILENGWDMEKLFHKKSRSNTLGQTYPKITQLERKLFNTTYENESNGDRLARLESSVFDTEFYYDNEEERIHRLESAIKGQQSASKYDNNKFQQRLNTAMQIGAMILMVLACIL